MNARNVSDDDQTGPLARAPKHNLG